MHLVSSSSSSSLLASSWSMLRSSSSSDGFPFSFCYLNSVSKFSAGRFPPSKAVTRASKFEANQERWSVTPFSSSCMLFLSLDCGVGSVIRLVQLFGGRSGECWRPRLFSGEQRPEGSFPDLAGFVELAGGAVCCLREGEG